MDGDTGVLGVPQVNTIIENYEILTTELVKELNFVKSEHDDLKGKVSRIVQENQRLAEQLSELLSSKDGNGTSKTDLNENLRHQVDTLLEEKDHAIQLWQNSMTSIGILEDELKVYKAGSQELIPKKDFFKVKKNYEEKIRILEDNLKIIQKSLDDSIKTANTQFVSKTQELDKALETQNNAFKIVKNLEDEVLLLQSRLQDIEKMNKKLQKASKENNETIEKLCRKSTEYRNKVEEAVQVVEAALNEKDAAIFREKQANDEIERINRELTDIVRETENKIRNEVAHARVDFSRKHEEIVNELRKSQDELKIKSLEVEKFSTKCQLLEEEIHKFRQGNFNFSEANTSKLLVLEKNLESTFQKLLVSEKNNIQLVSEKETMKNDMEQMAGHYERTLKAKEIEKLSLQNRLKQFGSQLDEERLLIIGLKNQLETARKEKDSIERQSIFRKDDLERSLNHTYTRKIEEITATYNSTIKDLQVQVDTKDRMNKKWMSETKIIIENLEKLLSDMRSEVHRLKKDNKKLIAQLRDSKNKFEQYKGFLQVISQDVNKITHTVVNASDKPG